MSLYSKISLAESVRSSKIIIRPKGEGSLYSNLSESLEKKTYRASLPALQTLPEVVLDDVSAERESTCQSTERICNENDCFDFKYIPNPGLYRAYHGKGKPQEAESEEDMYLRMVKQVQIPPVGRVLRCLKESASAIHLQYYGLDPRHIKPLCQVLEKNQTVNELNLKGNPLNDDAMFHLGQMLRTTHTLVKLDLQHCQIGAQGAELLGDGLQTCGSLRDLDLSYNRFGDEGMELLGIKLGYNSSIRRLCLSHNSLTHLSGFHLADTMEENISIQELDLSWNQISQPEGLKKFLYAAAEFNESLVKLNLSWNNLGGEKTSAILKNFITQHRTLEELDLSYNKLETESETTKLAKGLNTAVSLKQLNLSYNGITADVGFAIISSINGNKAKLDKLVLENLWVNPEFHKLSEELRRQCGLRVMVQGVYGGTVIKPPDMQSMLLQRAHFLGNKPKKKKKRKDFGWFLLRLQKAGTLVPVKKAKFLKLVVEDNIKFDEGMVDEFAKRFRNEEKRVDLELMLERYLTLYPDTALPKPKEKKKKKGQEKQENVPIEGEPVETEKKESLKGSKDVRMSLNDENVPKVELVEGGELETTVRTSLTSESSKRRVSLAEAVIGGDSQIDGLIEAENIPQESVQEINESINKQVEERSEKLETQIVESSNTSENEGAMKKPPGEHLNIESSNENQLVDSS